MVIIVVGGGHGDRWRCGGGEILGSGRHVICDDCMWLNGGEMAVVILMVVMER